MDAMGLGDGLPLTVPCSPHSFFPIFIIAVEKTEGWWEKVLGPPLILLIGNDPNVHQIP